MNGQPVALVIDDDDDIRVLISTILTRAGFRPGAADGGFSALSAARRNPPSVYVLDVRMPDMNGHDVCRQLKADRRTNAPVLMVSAEATAEDIAAGFAAGCDDFLPKPFRPKELLARLNQLLAAPDASVN
jgi:two-component system, OmpR family, response regulator